MNNLYSLIEKNLFWFLAFPYIIGGILLLLSAKYKKDKTYSISKHAASSKRNLLIFTIMLTIGSLPLYLTILFYLIPKYEINSIIVSILPILIFISEIIIAIVPDKGGIKSKIHINTAYIGMLFTIIFCFSLFLFGSMDFYLKLLLIQFVIIVSIILATLLFNKKPHKHIFALEIIFILNWVITIFSLAFI